MVRYPPLRKLPPPPIWYMHRRLVIRNRNMQTAATVVLIGLAIPGALKNVNRPALGGGARP